MRTYNLPIPILLLAGLITLPGISMAQEAEAARDPCRAVCFNYRQLVILERAEAARQSCLNYLSPLSNPVVIRVRLAPELRQGLPNAVDDELSVTINGREVFERILSSDGAEATFGKDSLAPGCNTLALTYTNTQTPDAHFMAQLGGIGFCPNESFCQTYREGLTFGTGIVNRSTLGVPATVISGQAFKSRIENPNTVGCNRCQDPP